MTEADIADLGVPPIIADVKRELGLLLDAFPDDAILLHTAFVLDAIDGAVGPWGWDDEREPGCSCAIGTIADAHQLEWNEISLALTGRSLNPNQTLPALESYLRPIRPGKHHARVPILIRWIEEWMRQADAKLAA